MTEALLEEDNGEEEAAAQDSSRETPSKPSFIKRMLGNKKKLILVFLILILLIAAGAGVWFFFFKGPSEAEMTAQQAKALEQADTAAPDVIEAAAFEDVIDIDPFEQIRLKEGSVKKYISLTLSLELVDFKFRKQVYSLQERIQKIVVSQVRELGWLQLRGPDGKIQLKYALLKRINGILPEVMVKNIYFTQFIMQ